MQSKPTTPVAYIDSLPEDRKKVITELRNTIRKNLPKGFEEEMSSGMLGYVVPHSLYPAGYHVNPKTPLPFICLASQKNFIALYHMGLYATPDLLKWFETEFAKRSRLKLDMGKSCVRFKKPDEIPIDLIEELCRKMTPAQWIKQYETVLANSRKK